MHDSFDDLSILSDLTGSGAKPDLGKADLIGSDATPRPERADPDSAYPKRADPEGTAPVNSATLLSAGA